MPHLVFHALTSIYGELAMPYFVFYALILVYEKLTNPHVVKGQRVGKWQLLHLHALKPEASADYM